MPSEEQSASWKVELDTIAGVYERTPTPYTAADYRAPSGHPFSGRWIGCWINPVHQLRPAWMDLELDLDDHSTLGERTVRAIGTDVLGTFSLTGAIHEESRTVNLVKQYTPPVGLAARNGIPYFGVVDDDAIRGVYVLSQGDSHLFACYHALALDPAIVAIKARAARPSPARAHLELAASLLSIPLRWPAVARRAKLAERVRELLPAPPSRVVW